MIAVDLALASGRFSQITPAALGVRLSLIAVAALSLVAF